MIFESAVKEGDAAIKEKRWDDALEIWSQILSEKPNDPKPYIKLAAAQKGLKKFDLAADILEQGIKATGAESVHQERIYLADDRQPKDPLASARLIKRMLNDVPTPKEFSQEADLIRRSQTDPRLAELMEGLGTFRTRKPGEPIRVLFYLYTVTQTDNVTPLYEKMFEDRRFEPIILSCDDATTTLANAFAYFNWRYPASSGHKVFNGGKFAHCTPIYNFDPDVVVCHTPYSNGANTPFYNRANFFGRHARVIHINYGYHLNLGAKNAHTYMNDQVQKAWRVYAENEDFERAYLTTIERSHVVRSGSTKIDACRKALASLRPTKTGRLNVIWTPHWQFANDPTGGTQTTTFKEYQVFMRKVAAMEHVDLHIRPHPLLRGRMNTIGEMTLAEHDAAVDELVRLGATYHAPKDGADYITPLMAADVLISDFSSLIVEYAVTNRPVIFCRTDDVWNNGKWLGPFGKDLINAGCYIADNEADLDNLIELLLVQRQHPKKADLAKFTAERDMYPTFSACQAICDDIASSILFNC